MLSMDLSKAGLLIERSGYGRALQRLRVKAHGAGYDTNVERKEFGIDELCMEKCEGGGRAYARSLESYERRSEGARD